MPDHPPPCPTPLLGPLSHYLGHSDPGFTLRVYTHLMPSSDARARKAVDSLYEGTDPTSDGPETAQGQ
ncbi:hypothetical protein DVZ84_06105 [Streptomyces parvulus]|uniref:Integrase n=1 Tax=Streptomyces parvulus TaxID=146923 RepID=A0A369VEL2_9ACTN|nr:hypothetical protein DVZ84_06105 [Streptomyces parvulus]